MNAALGLHRRDMPQATLRFYAELNDFLPLEDRHQPVQKSFRGRPSIKDLIEAAGVPHPLTRAWGFETPLRQVSARVSDHF